MAAGTMAPAMDRSLVQRMDALGEANRVRSWRKDLKADLKAGRKSVRQVIARPPAEVETMKVMDLLLAAPKVGRVKANKLLARERISPSKTVGGMSPRQRVQLVAALGGRR